MRGVLLCGVLMALVVAAAATTDSDGKEEAEKYGKRMKKGSVMDATNMFFKAAKQHQLPLMLAFINKYSVFKYNSELPGGGVYKGYMGLMDSIHKSMAAFNLDNFDFKLKRCDESRGFAEVHGKYSGTFNRTGTRLDNAKFTTYLWWSLGKIRKAITVDHDYDKVLDAYRTKAEKVANKFIEMLHTDPPKAKELLADQVNTSFRGYPKEISEALSLKGKNDFDKWFENVKFFLVDNHHTVKPLYADKNVAVFKSMVTFGRRGSHCKYARFMRPPFGVYRDGLSTSKLHRMKCISTVKINDQGLIESCIVRPLAPLRLADINTLKQLGAPFVGGKHNATETRKH